MLKRSAIFLTVLFSIVILFQYIFLPFFIRHEKVQERIIERISEETAGSIRFSDFSLRFFPSLSFRIRDVSYESKNEEEPFVFKADTLKAKLSLWSLFQRKIQLKDFVVENANLKGKTKFFSNQPLPFALDGFSIEAKGIRSKNLGSFRARGNFGSEESFFDVKGSLSLGDLAEFKLEEVLCDLTIELSQLLLSELPLESVLPIPLKIVGGGVTGWIHVIKKEERRKGEWSAKLDVVDIVYADLDNSSRSFPKSTQAFESQGSWDVEEGRLTIFSSRISAEGLEGELIGDFGFGPRGIQDFDLHISFPEFDFEQINSHYPFLAYWLNTEMTAKGKGEIRFQVKGNFDAFKLHGEIVLNEASLRHPYLRKEAGLPLALVADLELGNQSIWSGKFDFRYQELKIKGTVVEWNRENQDIEFTFLTNKFLLDTLFKLTASQSPHTLWQGDAKILIHYKGNLKKPDQAEVHGLVNLDGISYQVEDFPLQTPPLFGTLKIESTEAHLEEAYFLIGEEKAPVSLTWKGWQNPRIEWTTEGKVLDVKALLSSVEKTSETGEGAETAEVSLLSDVFLPSWLQQARIVGEVDIEVLTFEDISFSPLKGTMIMQDGRWQMVFKEASGAGGKIWIEGEQDLRRELTPQIRVYGKNLDLERIPFLSELRLPLKLGTLSFRFHNTSQPAVQNKLRGSFVINNGGLDRLDIIKSIYSAWGKEWETRDGTFNRLAGRFRLTDDQTIFEDLVLNSKKLFINGSGRYWRTGEIELELNSMLNRHMSDELAGRLSNRERLMVPLKIRGTAKEPEVIPQKGQTQNVLNKAFMDDITHKLRSFYYLDQQVPRKLNIPNKTRFLEMSTTPSASITKKAGFFESFFGRRR